MSEAVTVPRLMMMALIVSDELLGKDRQTDAHIHTGSSLVKFSQSLRTLKTKKVETLQRRLIQNFTNWYES